MEGQGAPQSTKPVWRSTELVAAKSLESTAERLRLKEENGLDIEDLGQLLSGSGLCGRASVGAVEALEAHKLGKSTPSTSDTVHLLEALPWTAILLC